MNPINCPTVIVLASGRGERFLASGGKTPKLQALLGGRTVLGWTLEAVRMSGLRWHLEAVGHCGMGDSIAAAVRATASASSWLILPGDLPFVQPATLRLMAELPMQKDVALPVVQGKRGHPVRFSSACGPKLMALTGPTGAGQMPCVRNAQEVPLEDRGCTFDIDTVEDLANAHRWLTAHNACVRT